MAKKHLTQEEVDQLKEITNIGAGNAATALSHMLGKKIGMTVPDSFVGGITDVQRMLGKTEDTVVATFLKVHGDLEGAMVMILPPKSAIDFVDILTKEKIKDIKELQQKDLSAIQEMGNILLGASITALNKFLDMTMIHSIPDVAVDMLGAVMDEILVEIGSDTEEILAFRINLHLEGKKVGGDLYYLFDPNSSSKILKMTSKKV
ncbi:hypothetical protein C0581_02465 [Candidatus Parcubacteria bacterium]|nr:MAG: hypothetical protein C0581_02465 [Candidatus Parcubacteria bacterium]